MQSTKIYIWKNCFILFVFKKQKQLKDLNIKIVYIFPQCIYNKYYACDFRRSLLLLANHYHYFHHLNVQKCWSFIEPESNVNLQPKSRKVTEKKTPLPKSVNKKTMFPKILSCQEAHEGIEIDSDWSELIQN